VDVQLSIIRINVYVDINLSNYVHKFNCVQHKEQGTQTEPWGTEHARCTTSDTEEPYVMEYVRPGRYD